MKQRIGVRLMGAFAALFLLMTALAAAGQYMVQEAQSHYEELAEYASPLQIHVAALTGQVYQMSSSLRGFGLYGETEYLTAYQQAAERAAEALSKAQALPLAPEDSAALQELADLLHHYKIINESMTELSSTGATATAVKILQKGRPVAQAFSEKVEALQQGLAERAASEQQIAREQTRLASYIAAGSAAGGLLIALVSAFLLTRSITRPIRGLATLAREVAAGDLTRRPVEATRDEVGDLSRAFAGMMDSLREALAVMRHAGEHLTASSHLLTRSAAESAANAAEIVERLGTLTAEWELQGDRLAGTGREVVQLEAAIAQVAGGAKEQAELVQTAAGLMQQVAATVGVIAEAGTQVAAASQEAFQRASRGGEAVAQVQGGLERVRQAAHHSAAAMEELTAQSHRIGEITRLIEGIAGQTSLLALNAAIEAARAGENGRGFAVVAQEVGNLARRSKEAASEISQLVQMIQRSSHAAASAAAAVSDEAESGAVQAREAGTALRAIITAMKGVVSQTEGIAAGVQQIAAHAEEASRSVTQAADFTAQTVAAVSQMSSAAGAIAGTMGELTAALDRNQAMATQLLAGTHQMKESVETVNGSAQKLTELAAEFSRISGGFVLSDTTVTSGSAIHPNP
ncbi:MAG: methyl-accepting chemotaxis protein [Bacillota bacterium]